MSAGEIAGFTVPAAAGIWSHQLAAGAQLAVLSTAGLFEGALLGAAQALVLRETLPGFRARPWVWATSLAAAVAWFLGMLPSTTHDTWSAWPVGVWVLAAVIAGVLLLGSIGTAQALVLPPHIPRRFTWVAWTALGWCAGLTAFGVVAPPLWHEGQPTWVIALIGLLGAVTMAVTMAAVTGVGARRLVARATAAQQRPTSRATPL